jgi:hypothetical protein
MTSTNKLLDKYREVCGYRTDMSAAEGLGISRAAVSAWRHEHRHAEADAIEKMCIATGEPVAVWLHQVEAERARTPAARKVWLRLAQAAACITLIVGITVLTATPARASEAVKSFNNSCAYIHYAHL